MRPLRRPVAALLLAVTLTGVLGACASGSATPAAPSVDASCPPVEIRDASGAPIDLTGPWSGNDGGQYRLRQIGSCLTWVGLSDFEGQSLGDTWVTTFRGQIAADRTISGEFLDVSGENPGSGTFQLRIDDSPDVVGGVVINRVSATGSDYGGTFWEPATEGPAELPTDEPAGSPGTESPDAELPSEPPSEPLTSEAAS